MSKKNNARIKICFNPSYMLLRVTEQSEFRDKVKKECNWGSDDVFGKKKNGNRSMLIEDWKIIKGIFADYGIDANNECLMEDN